MSDYKIPDDLRPWAEATAPKLTAEDWPRLERFVASWNDVGGGLTGKRGRITRTPERSHFLGYLGRALIGIDQARALLAYRDEVAAGLSYRPRVMLARVVAGHQPESNDGYHECVRLAERRMLAVVDGQWFARDWGREIARVLGGADPRELLCTCIDDVDTDPDCTVHGARVLGGAS